MTLHPTSSPTQQADAGAWPELHRFVRQYVLARTKRHDLADDIAQETVVKLIEYSRTNQVATIHGLGFRIAKTLILKHHHSAARTGEMTDEEPASEAPLPDHVVAMRQEADLVATILHSMPKLRREVLVRRRIRGESCARIAQEMNMSVKAVEKHITRGLRDLTEAMGRRTPHE